MNDIPFMVGVDSNGRTVLSLDDGETSIAIALAPGAVRRLIELLAAPNSDHFWVATSELSDIEEKEDKL